MAKKNKKEKKPGSYSHALLTQESVLIWITTLAFLALAFYCIFTGYTGSIPWLTALVSVVWTAYGVSQVAYYKKSEKENTTGGIKFETVLEEVRQKYNQAIPNIDWSISNSAQTTPFTTITSTNNGSNPTGVGIGQSIDVDIDYGI